MGRTRPNRHRIVVVLPAPFGPRKPNTPPAGTSRSRPATATAVPDLERYSLRRPRIEIGYPSPSVTSHIAVCRVSTLLLGGESLDRDICGLIVYLVPPKYTCEGHLPRLLRAAAVSDSGRRFLRVGAQGEGQAASLHLCSRRVTAGARWVVGLVGGSRDGRTAAHLYHHHRPSERPGCSPPRPDAGCNTARPVGPMAGWAPA